MTVGEHARILARLRRAFPDAVYLVIAVTGPPEAPSRGVILYGADLRPARAPFLLRPHALLRLMRDAARLSDTSVTLRLDGQPTITKRTRR